MLRAHELSRHYAEVVAVDRVSFEVSQGEITGLLGHNGAGKTTVMKLLTGFIEPSNGTASVGEVDVQEDPVGARAALGYLPETQALYPEQSVVDYLWFAATMRGIEPAERAGRIKQALDDTELNERAFDQVGTLSRGYQQRVGVAQAILHRPPVLILDEPTNGLDPTQTQHMRDLIRRLAEHSTIILSTHIMQEVEAICDRVLIMRNGQLVVDETLENLRKAHRIVLDTSAERHAVQHSLRDIVSVEAANGRLYLTPIHAAQDGLSEANLQEVVANIVNACVAADIPIFGIEPERRDLEVLFQEVNEARHAN